MNMRSFLLLLVCVVCVCGQHNQPVSYSYSFRHNYFPTGTTVAPIYRSRVSHNQNVVVHYPTPQFTPHYVQPQAQYTPRYVTPQPQYTPQYVTPQPQYTPQYVTPQPQYSSPQYIQEEPPEEIKSIYVHLPAAQPVVVRPRVIQKPRKHYKIIFIKPPAPPTTPAPEIPPQEETEEKTLIYVLIPEGKKSADIVLPTAPPKKPSKPEIYFVKYSADKKEIVKAVDETDKINELISSIMKMKSRMESESHVKSRSIKASDDKLNSFDVYEPS